MLAKNKNGTWPQARIPDTPPPFIPGPQPSWLTDLVDVVIGKTKTKKFDLT